MLQYTKDSLKTHLQTWVEGNGVDADAEFMAALDEIIRRGELKVMRDLDLENLDGWNDTATTANSDEVFKPLNLTMERAVTITAAGRRRFLLKRSRAWVEFYNALLATGIPRYYAELDEGRWTLAPVANAALLISVAGFYNPASLIDGPGAGTTWLSTRVPDLLSIACRIEAAEFLEFWAHKAQADAEYNSRFDDVKAMVKNLQRADIEDVIGNRNVVQTPTQPPEPAAT